MTEPKPGSLPHLLAVILRRRRYAPTSVAQLAVIAKVEAPQVSNALQRLQELGLARRTDEGWTYQRPRSK